MRANLRRTLSKLVNDQAYIHMASGYFFITKLGIRTVDVGR